MKRSLTIIALAACLGCDSGDEGDSPGAEFLADSGVGAQCFADEDCPRGSVCFDGTCVFQGNEGPGEPAPGGPDGEPAPPPAPPEMEEILTPANRPAAGPSVVWVVAPETDRVAAIDGAALTVTLTEVGDRPTAVAVRAGTDTAVVLCRGSDELVVVEPGRADIETHRLPGHFNALSMGPFGRFAYAWFDLSDVEPGEDASAVQDAVVIDLDTGRQHPVTVGFAPRDVRFADDGTALFNTDDGVSVIAPEALDGPAVALTVPTAPDIFSLADREVVLTADGRYAASRAPGEHGITVVDLTEGVPRAIDLGAEPTDLDLIPADAERGHVALVMLREARRLALVPLDGGEVRFVELGPRPLGSAAVSTAGDRAVLYATRADHAPAAALLALPSGEVIDVPLRKRARVGAVDQGVAWILHGPESPTIPGAPIVLPEPAPAGQQQADDMGIDDMGPDDMGPDDMGIDDMGPEDMGPDAAPPVPPVPVVDPTLAARHGYSLIDLRTGFVKLQTTAAEPYGLTFAPGAAFVAYPRTDAAPRLERIDLVRFDSRGWPLGSTAEAIGVLPAVERAFVTQDHPTGRISFVPLDTDGRITTLTGYALDGRIE